LKYRILWKRPRRDALETVDIVRSDNSNNNTDDDDDGEGGEYPITLRANYNTMRCEIRCAYRINFDKSNSIGSLLGFSSNATSNMRHESDMSINIMNINVIRVKYNAGAYCNDKNAIHEFSSSVRI